MSGLTKALAAYNAALQNQPSLSGCAVSDDEELSESEDYHLSTASSSSELQQLDLRYRVLIHSKLFQSQSYYHQGL